MMAQNRKLLSCYRSLMDKVKERQERLMEAEQHYQESSRFQHGWGEEDLASCRRLKEKLDMVEERLLVKLTDDISSQVKCFLPMFTLQKIIKKS